ncbi:serine/threonine-protein phosphatase 7 long form like [Fagus crenata]
MAKEEQSYSICEAREEEMVSLKDGNITRRIGRFLKPCVRYSNQAAKVPNVPLLSEFYSYYNRAWSSKVHFKGWKQHLKRWDEWTDKLAGKYGYKWNQTGICDAIMSSRYEIHCNRDLVLGLVEFWCAETNTFVFPWGEATITLEDVMILGGFPILGEQVTSSLSVELVEIEEEMKKLKKEFSRSKSKKANYGAWINYFMENENENEFEHVAFLSLWLSRHVFPSLPDDIVGNHVFPIAAHLSRGTKIALAPAVLASLYQNLRSLKESAVTSLESITVLGLFQIVQLWAFERFPGLRTNGLKPLQPGEPRVAQWHKLKSTFSLPSVKWCVLKSVEDFEWRPYAADLENWCHLSYYKEKEQLVIRNSSLDENFGSFLRCFCASELVGLGCTEKYMPHRVAMQFGMDQHLPGEFSDVNFAEENVHFVIPPRSFQPGVSAAYFSWWKECVLARKDAIKEVLLKQESSTKNNGKASSASKSPKKHGNASCASMFNSGIAKPKLEQIEEDILSNPKFAQSSITNRKMKSEILQSFGSEKNEVKCHIPTAVKNQENSQKSGQESHAAVSLNMFEISSDDESLDDVPISEIFKRRNNVAKRTSTSEDYTYKQPENVVTPTSSVGSGDSKKRKVSVSVDANELVRRANISANGQNGAPNEVHSEASESGNDLLDTAKGGDEEGKKRKTGGSFDNPIDVDDHMQTIGSKSQNLGLVERIKKLEILLGVKPK